MIPMPANAKHAHDDLAAKVAAMDMLLQTLARDNEQLRAKIAQFEQRNAPPPIALVPLKRAYRGAFSYETARAWCDSGIVLAEKRGGRWYVNTASLSAHLARLNAA
jgi:hypothetical protein